MLLGAVLLMTLAAPAGAASGGLARAPGGGLTGRVLVLLDRTALRHGHGHGPAQARTAAVRAAIAATGARPAGPSVPEIGLLTVRGPAGTRLGALLRRLRAAPGVASVQPEGRMRLRSSPNDPALSVPESSPGTPAGTPLQWAPAREGLFRAWDAVSGATARVGVIDTGVDASHPDLAGKVREAIDQDYVESDGPPGTDPNGHGTHVSSLACAGTDNGVGLAGAGYGCQIVLEKSDLGDASVASSIVDAAKRGVQAINMSFGSDGARPPVEAVVRAIDFARSRQVVLVAAAADQAVEEQGDPANLLQPTGTGPRIDAGKGLSVTAATFYDKRASFAGFGSQISLAAYGAFDPGNGLPVSGSGPPGIFAAFPGNRTSLENEVPSPAHRTTLNGDSRYAYLQGTSMAAPQVAAAAALVRALNPDLPGDEVVRLLKATARQPAGGHAWNGDLGWGILDAGAAVAAAAGIDRHAPSARLRVTGPVRRGQVALAWSGSDGGPAGVRHSGIRAFEVFARRRGAPRREIARTAAHRRRFRGRPGARYTFFVLAIDRAGNREALPRRAQAVARFARRRR